MIYWNEDKAAVGWSVGQMQTLLGLQRDQFVHVSSDGFIYAVMYPLTCLIYDKTNVRQVYISVTYNKST